MHLSKVARRTLKFVGLSKIDETVYNCFEQSDISIQLSYDKYITFINTVNRKNDQNRDYDT